MAEYEGNFFCVWYDLFIIMTHLFKFKQELINWISDNDEVHLVQVMIIGKTPLIVLRNHFISFRLIQVIMIITTRMKVIFKFPMIIVSFAIFIITIIAAIIAVINVI